MRLNRTEIEKRYPSEELRLALLDQLTLLTASYKELDRLLMNKRWKALGHKLADVQAQAREAEWTVNRIIWPGQELVNADVPDDTPRESER